MNGALKRIQRWYLGNCDGAWEHSYGVQIATLDNPGWAIRIELAGTLDAEREFREISLERSDNDWVLCRKAGLTLEAFCGPENLTEALNFLADWLFSGALK